MTDSPLHRLASNLRWAWQPEAQRLFREVDPNAYRAVKGNPVALLADAPEVPQGAVEHAAALANELADHLADERTWADVRAHALRVRPVAYLSMEFGLHESLPIYSGGLGVLAGDHLKSASDLGVPLVAVGMLYREGYFDQSLDDAGWQREDYPTLDPDRQPVQPAVGADGEPVHVRVEVEGGAIAARVWEANVGRVRLFLLDTDVDDNTADDRRLTARLYSGDRRHRIRQELLLGVGGVRALDALGIRPGVLHMNEGHCAFAVLELVRLRMLEEGIGFGRAAERVAQQSVFTTHTPVPAGHDRFEPELVEEHISPLRKELGLDADALLALGRVRGDDDTETFCMTVLAMKMAHHRNGVSNLHGRISRKMWRSLWPEREEHEVPIGHVTNGVHLRTWMAPAMRDLLCRELGDSWLDHQADPEAWAPVDDIDDGVLWATHQRLKRDLIDFVRDRAATAAESRHEPAEVVSALRGALDEDTLLIGFARRFATYKRAALLLQDEDALDRLVNHGERPVRLVFAGKAHPRDDGGKRLIQRIHTVTRDPRFVGKVIFVEGYDMEVGRRLTSGVDVWLNNPRRPLEASGTSGQKVVLNGGLNCSVLDGWWAEAFDGRNGFAIGSGLTHQSPEQQDGRDHVDLTRVLTEAVVPSYYAVQDGLPREWIGRVKRSMRTLAWRFGADRMVQDYVRSCYLPAAGLTPIGMPA